MLKFKSKDGTVVGVLKDSASEPEGDFMKNVAYKTEDEMVEALPVASEEEKSLEELEAEVKDAE